MASSFSDLGIELMATGENAGTWGTKTNTNLQIVEKAIAGYVEQAVTSGGTTTLSITDGDATESTSVARHAVIKLTGTITGNSIVTVPDSIEKVYIVTNGTSGAYTVQFKTASGTGITFGVSEKTTRLVYSDGTNIVDAGFSGASDLEGRELVLDADGDTTITADTDDQIDIKIAGADDFQFTANTFTAQSGSSIVVPEGGLTFGSTAITSTAAELNLLDGVSGLVQADLTKLAAVDSTAAELNIVDGGTSATSTTVADADRVVLNDNGTMVQVAVTDLAAYFDDEITAMPNLTSVGTLTTLTVDNVIVNGTTIGHTDDTDLITLADGVATVAGEISVTTLDIGGTNVTATAAEINLIDGDTARGTTAVADGDGLLVNDAGTMRMTNVTTLKTYFQSGISTAADDLGTGDGAVTIATSSGNITIDAQAGDADIIFKGTDSSSDITALTLDMSDAGSATFNHDIILGNNSFVQFGDAGEKMVGDGTDLTINSSNDLNLTATTDINIPANVGLTFGDDGEKIEGDGTDLTIAGNNINLTAATDVIIPTNVGLHFTDANEKIESDGTDLTFNSGNDINLTATTDINVPSGVGMTFGDDGEKIEGDGTDLTIASSAKINLTATSDVHIPNNVGIVFGGDSEKIEGDGTDLVISANNLTIDAAADITLDAAGNDFSFKAGGTEILKITNSSSDVIIKPIVDTKDLIFQQRDGTEVARIEDNGTFNVVTDKLAINGTAVTSTAAELNKLDGAGTLKQAGKETIWIPAVAMYPNSTNGCAALAQTELSNGPEIKTLDFDKDSDEFAQFAVAFPKSWNEGTVTFQAFFTAATTNTGTTAWGLSGVALADDGSLNTSFGTQVVATAKAMSGTSNDLAVTAESGAVTIAGSPSTDEYVFFEIFRDVSADSLTADSKLLGIKLFFTTDAANDA